MFNLFRKNYNEEDMDAMQRRVSMLMKRLQTLEEALFDMSTEMSNTKAIVMRLNAKSAVNARLEKKDKQYDSDEILKSLLNAEEIVDITDKYGSKLSGTQKTGNYTTGPFNGSSVQS